MYNEVGNMSSNDTKHVQTELSEDEYQRFREFAAEHGLSLKEAGHEAVIEWIERQQRADPNDRAFTVLDEIDEPDGSVGAETDAREEADLIETWTGSDADFTLETDPGSRR